ncbi:LuxR family transcriptional regulator [Rubellimicrobium sp. CFH 75288]|nr:LuxR family transcriptional regulator [Rubellimicrobium sp. CFH 75288]
MSLERFETSGRHDAPLGTAPGGSGADIAALAPGGHYLAYRVGFALPMEEVIALPAEWVSVYTRRGYMLHDPVMRWAFATQGTIRWSDLRDEDPHGLLAEAASFGLRFGAAVSVLDPATGERSIGSFVRPDREFRDVEILALEVAVQTRHAALRPPVNITPAEVEALRLVRSGQRLKQIAWQLGVSEGAIKQRLRSARVKLEAKTGPEAISRAAALRLI